MSDYDAGYFFKFMEKIAERHTQFAKVTLSLIKFAVSDAEAYTNLGAKNMQLRNNLSKYEGAIEAFGQKGPRIYIDNFS